MSRGRLPQARAALGINDALMPSRRGNSAKLAAVKQMFLTAGLIVAGPWLICSGTQGLLESI